MTEFEKLYCDSKVEPKVIGSYLQWTDFKGVLTWYLYHFLGIKAQVSFITLHTNLHSHFRSKDVK